MDRQEVIAQIRQILARSGFFLSDDTDTHHISFDIVARRDSQLLFIKVLTNVDSFSASNASQLKTLANLLKGVPILIGSRSTARAVEPGVLYLRHGVGILSLETLYDHLIEGVPPMIYSAPGGFYVRIDPSRLARERATRGRSLRELATVAGVSRKAIQLYENGMAPTLESAMALEEYLGVDLVEPLDPFTYDREAVDVETQLGELEGIEKMVLQRLARSGYDVIPTHRCPFNALTRDESATMLTAIGNYDAGTRYRLRSMANISRVTEKKAFYILTNGPTRKMVEGVPTICFKELQHDPEGLREEIRRCMEGL